MITEVDKKERAKQLGEGLAEAYKRAHPESGNTTTNPLAFTVLAEVLVVISQVDKSAYKTMEDVLSSYLETLSNSPSLLTSYQILIDKLVAINDSTTAIENLLIIIARRLKADNNLLGVNDFRKYVDSTPPWKDCEPVLIEITIEITHPNAAPPGTDQPSQRSPLTRGVNYYADKLRPFYESQVTLMNIISGEEGNSHLVDINRQLLFVSAAIHTDLYGETIPRDILSNFDKWLAILEICIERKIFILAKCVYEKLDEFSNINNNQEISILSAYNFHSRFRNCQRYFSKCYSLDPSISKQPVSNMAKIYYSPEITYGDLSRNPPSSTCSRDMVDLMRLRKRLIGVGGKTLFEKARIKAEIKDFINRTAMSHKRPPAHDGASVAVNEKEKPRTDPMEQWRKRTNQALEHTNSKLILEYQRHLTEETYKDNLRRVFGNQHSQKEDPASSAVLRRAAEYITEDFNAPFSDHEFTALPDGPPLEVLRKFISGFIQEIERKEFENNPFTQYLEILITPQELEECRAAINTQTTGQKKSRSGGTASTIHEMILRYLAKAFSSTKGSIPDWSKVTNEDFRKLLCDSNLYLNRNDVNDLNKLFNEVITNVRDKKHLHDHCKERGFLSLYDDVDKGLLALITNAKKVATSSPSHT